MGKNKKKADANRARKQARRNAKQKAHAKKRAVSGSRFSQFGASRTAIREAPFDQAMVSETLFEAGIGYVLVTRALDNGQIAAGYFLLDVHCLGVKDSFLAITDRKTIEDRIMRMPQPLAPISEAEAFKLIHDAIAYGRDLGFEPDGSFVDASLVLRELTPGECDKKFTFGKDGMPFYVQGPNHGPAKATRIVRQLLKRCGRGNFHYLLELSDLPNDIEEPLITDAE